MCSYSYFTGLTNVKQIGEGGGGLYLNPRSLSNRPTSYCIHFTSNPNSSKICMGQMEPLFSYSCPFGIQPLGHPPSQEESCSPLSESLCSFLKVLVFH